MTIKLRYFLTKLLISMCVVLGGCNGDDEAKRQSEIEHSKSALKRVAGLKKRFQQLDTTLTQMDSEADIQKQKIASAKSELKAIREMLASGRLKDVAGDYQSTAPLPVARISSDDGDSKDAQTEAARDGVFRTLVILLFALFAGVYLAKLWRDRHNVPPVPEDKTFEVGAYDSTEGKQSTPPNLD